jgi:hypothetical protein
VVARSVLFARGLRPRSLFVRVHRTPYNSNLFYIGVAELLLCISRFFLLAGECPTCFQLFSFWQGHSKIKRSEISLVALPWKSISIPCTLVITTSSSVFLRVPAFQKTNKWRMWPMLIFLSMHLIILLVFEHLSHISDRLDSYRVHKIFFLSNLKF